MRLLLIEDEKELTKTLKKGLKEAGYNVDVAYDGESGVAMAISGQYDCIILDLRLPKKDGLEVCKEIRRNKIDRSNSNADRELMRLMSRLTWRLALMII
ncbi:MAG: response regulator [Candidatus Kryptonium sp.]